jgi:hypothetical protein
MYGIRRLREGTTITTPGFTAENSLAPSATTYRGIGSVLAVENEVYPEFLGVVREAVSAPFKNIDMGSLMSGLSKLRPSGGGSGDNQPYVCQQWAGRLLACRDGRPAFSRQDIAIACFQNNSRNLVNGFACSTVANSLYSLLEKQCGENPAGVQTLLGQICH